MRNQSEVISNLQSIGIVPETSTTWGDGVICEESNFCVGFRRSQYSKILNSGHSVKIMSF